MFKFDQKELCYSCVVLSNQIKIKTNVGRTGPSERATDPQSPMSPDSAPDINIVKQISRDEET